MNNAFLLGVIAPAMCAYFAFSEPVATPEVQRTSAPSCDLGGPSGRVADYLALNVTVTDVLSRRGDMRGRAVPSERIEQAAAEYARAQPHPGALLALLTQCLPDAKVRYPVGYEIIAQALFREAQRRPSP